MNTGLLDGPAWLATGPGYIPEALVYIKRERKKDGKRQQPDQQVFELERGGWGLHGK